MNFDDYRCETPKFVFHAPEYSEWTCYLFGGSGTGGIRYIPLKGHVPNWFVRFMMKICFDCKWVKNGK